jgi:hypothetical protein
LARLRLRPARRASARGARIGRFLAAGDRVLAPARQLLEHRSSELAPIEVFGAALRDPGTAAARQTARRGPGGRPRCSAPRCLACSTLVCRSRAHAPGSGPARWPPLQHTTRPPHSRSDRPGCCRRTARSAGPAPAGRGHRCPSAPPFDDARPAEGGSLIRAASTSPATAGLPAVPGVAALLRSTRPSTSSGWYPALCHRHHPPRSGPSVRLSSQALVAALWCSCHPPRDPTAGPFH